VHTQAAAGSAPVRPIDMTDPNSVNAARARRAIRNVFGVPPAPRIHTPPRSTLLRRIARADWPDLDDLLTRRLHRSSPRQRRKQ